MTKKKATETVPEKKVVDLTSINTARAANNFLTLKKGGEHKPEDLNLLNEYLNYTLNQAQNPPTKYKVGLMFICINQPYWQYLRPVVEGAKHFFLPGHDVEIMVWNDMHQYVEARGVNYGCTVFPVESIQWPYPTLMRYNYFLREEEYLKKFDYIFYLDLDMRLVGVVGDEILGPSLTMAQHPMYAIPHYLWYPYEPNPESAAFIKQPGRVVDRDGKRFFQPLYAAGGLQGGVTQEFIKAMKAMQEGIDADMARGYIARWNDESHWNKYLFERGMDDVVVLSPSYVYPDSMIDGYYKPKVWHKDYTPKIITLTKPFTVSKEGGAAAAELMKQP